MDIKRSVIILLAVAVAGSAAGQFISRDLARRAEWEAFLVEAEVVQEVQLPFEKGVTEPWQLTLRRGREERRAIWKDATGVRGGYLEGWRYEIAAYVVDKLLGVGMVPPTVLRVHHGHPGSIQLWIDSTSLYRDLQKREENEERFGSDAWRNASYIAQFFDNLIGNEDRHTGNVLVTRDFRAILIDHSRTFRVGPSFTEALPYSEKNVAVDDLMRRLPRKLVERTEALTEQELREALSDLLSETEIQALLARRRLLLDEVRRIAAKFGERDVLY
jgi:hypothetical protein